mgnify:CR=1 FL=1
MSKRLKVFPRARILILALMLIAGVPAASGNAVLAQAAWDCADFPFVAPDITAATPESEPVAGEAIPFPENAGDVTIFAASSLTDVFSEIETSLEQVNPGLDLIINFEIGRAHV